jgi:3-dehydroquinate synthase
MKQQGEDGHRITVTCDFASGAVSYNIYIGFGLLDRAGRLIAEACPAHRYAVVSDSRVADLYAGRLLESLKSAGLDGTLFGFAAGEWNKTRETWGELTDGMLRSGFGRDSAVIALGGGVVGDLAGFVAATYMRGLPVVQLPSTLLAMLDSSVGGKTGVDTAAGKNLVGSFHQPRLVLIDPSLLTTLPEPQLIAGLAEALKHGLIVDASYFEKLAVNLERIYARDLDLLSDIIARSVEIKAEVVSRDERESGYRRILNFGHTIGHAQESISGYGWLHGEAVAAGLVLESAIGEAVGVTEAGTAARVREVLLEARLPVELDSDVEPGQFFKVLEVDKKREGSRTRYTLLKEIGQVAGTAAEGWTREVADEVVGSVLFGQRPGGV